MTPVCGIGARHFTSCKTSAHYVIRKVMGSGRSTNDRNIHAREIN